MQIVMCSLLVVGTKRAETREVAPGGSLADASCSDRWWIVGLPPRGDAAVTTLFLLGNPMVSDTMMDA